MCMKVGISDIREKLTSFSKKSEFYSITVLATLMIKISNLNIFKGA